MSEHLGRRSGDGYWTADLHISMPSPVNYPPGGLLTVKVCFNSTNLVIYLDQHGICRWTTQYPVDQILTPTLHCPGTMNRADCYSFLHQWLHSSHLNLPLEDDVATDLSNRVIDRAFERLDVNGKLAVSVTVYLHHVSIEYAPYVPPIDSDDDDDDDEEEEEEDEGLPEYWVNMLSCLYEVVAEEEHGNCSICLECLVSDDDDDDDEDEDEEEDKYLFESPCGHVFHDECMMEWLRKRDSCPMCRFTVSSEIDEVLEDRLCLLMVSDST